MNDKKKLMTCITGSTVRNIINEANKLELNREDIVNMFVLGGQIYLVFYKNN